MSLHPQPVPAISEQTSRVAHAAFPRDHVYLRMRDEFGSIVADDEFADLFPQRG
jgi:transposase